MFAASYRSPPAENPPPPSSRAAAPDHADAVGLHEALDAADQLVDHPVAPAVRGPQVESQRVGDHAVLATALHQRVQLGRLEHGLRRDAAAHEAGAAQAVLLHDGGAGAELGGADGGDVTAWTAADHGDVKALGHDSSFRWRYSREL